MVDNPMVVQLKKKKAGLASNLHKIKVKFTDKILKEAKDDEKEVCFIFSSELNVLTLNKSNLCSISLGLTELANRIIPFGPIGVNKRTGISAQNMSRSTPTG